MVRSRSETPAALGAEIARAYTGRILLPYQRRWLQDRSRFRIGLWARQAGKSFSVGLDAALGALAGRDQLLIAASQRQSLELIRKASAHLQALQQALGAGFRQRLQIRAPQLVRSPGKTEICLANKARIIALPGNPATVRGPTGDVSFDEAALAAHDEELWRAVLPMATRGDWRLSVVSTPFGDQGLFHRLWFSETGRWSRHKVTIHDAMAQGLRIDWPALQDALGDPDAISQEYECVFLSDALRYFSSDLIKSASYDPGEWREPTGTVRYAGIDIGRRRDRTTYYEIAVTPAGGRYILPGETLDRVPFDEQEERLLGLLRRGGVKRVAIDQGGLGMHLAENIARRFEGGTEPVTFTASVKESMVTELRKQLEQGRLHVPVDDRRLLRAFGAIRRLVTAANNVRFDAERDEAGHADEFWAAALALHAAPRKRRSGRTASFGGRRSASTGW